LHPLIRARTLQRVDAIEAPYAIVIVPLLLETDFVEFVERIVVVDCSESAQIARLRQRDGIGEHEARAMLDAQTARQTRLASADDVIDNSGSREQTAAQVAGLHARYLQLAAAKAD
jgi:dephospho-CoA kinase